MTDLDISEWRNLAATANWDDQTLALKAVDLAQQILAQSQKEMRGKERRQGEQLARMMNDAPGKAFTLALADRFFRAASPARRAEQFRYLLEGYGVPAYLSWMDRFAMKAGAAFSRRAPEPVCYGIERQLRAESAQVILPAEKNRLRAHAKRRSKEGVRLNFNQLGEAILGEKEAAERLNQLLDLLADPACNYVSVKISAIFSQISLVASEATLARIQECLRVLFRAAQANPATRPDGTREPKFVNLDMEEYRDLHLTCEAFKRTLMEEEFLNLRAGIVLQAYLPDSWEQQKSLCAWAKERAARGGATIKMRLVKGANLAMERVDASLHGWPQAPYETKAETDANFKRMLHEACRPENARFVNLGIASHNLFDFSYALLLAAREGVGEYVDFEMLEGMANHQVRAIVKERVPLLLYAPVVYRKDFPNAISYLVRRLDENTGEENFLHDVFGMTSSSPEWAEQKKRFLASCHERETVPCGPSRKQNRAEDLPRPSAPGDDFANEPDTDWSLPANVEWLRQHIEKERGRTISDLPVVVAGEEQDSPLRGIGRDPSEPGKPSYHFCYATFEQVSAALDCAERAAATWAEQSIPERAATLHRAAAELARARGELIAAMVRDTAKSPVEGDVEVSEAIDFCRYYADGLTRPGMEDGVEFKPLGAVCVAPPWNFPCAIPCGGVAAALMAGNSVLLKPAPPATRIAWLVANAFWKAGVPREVLQFVPVLPNEIGQKLLASPKLKAVILTGSHATARLFQEWNPERPVLAETSGKDSIIVTGMADLDQAVKDMVKSAFGHSGQKCSAASLAILEADVYDNAHFLNQLKDAVASLKVGSAWELDSVVVPLTQEPGAALTRGLTELDPGESWLLEPQRDKDNPRLWSPGIRLGVKPGSWFHKNECFGPVLGLMRAENLDEAIRIQNASDFGLTGGICTLDEREIARWEASVHVGNAYINRPITGAIVRRQPFGGWKKSSVGPGAKAGGPNYLTMLGSWTETRPPQQRGIEPESLGKLCGHLCNLVPDAASRLKAASGSIAKWWREEFGVDHDPSQCLGERNTFRYLAAETVVRVEETMSDADLAIVLMAARQTGARLRLSLAGERSWLLPTLLPPDAEMRQETRDQFTARFGEWAERDALVRDPAADGKTRRRAQAVSLRLIERPVLANARIELLAYLREQSVSETTHRYGNIVARPGQAT